MKAISFRNAFLTSALAGALVLVCSSPAAAREERFFVDAGRDVAGRGEVRAEHLLQSARAEIWVEEEYWDGLDAVGQEVQRQQAVLLAAVFDDIIYPGVRGLLGEERSPGLDARLRISVVLAPMRPGEVAYARPFVDGTSGKGSNRGEVLYVNAGVGVDARTKAALTSAFAEVVVYNERVVERGVTEEPWLLAMLASYAPTHLGYDEPFAQSQLAVHVQHFLEEPNNSFLRWEGRADDAASASLFTHFLVGYYGERLIPLLVRSPRSGTEAISSTLLSMGYKDTFVDALEAWAVASYVNGEVVGESGGYAYTHPSLGFGALRVRPDYRAPIGEGHASISRFGMEPASAQWVRFTPATLGSNGLNTLNITVQEEGAGTTRLVLVETAIDGTSRLRSVVLEDGTADVGVELFGNYVLSVVLIAVNPTQKNSLLSVEAYSREADRTNPAGALPDGSLIRQEGSDRVYVVGGAARRWIQSPAVFNAYAHLRWEDVREVPASTTAWYRESFLVRVAGKEEVYLVNERGQARWLDMSAREFERSGYRWEDVFVINELEFVWYAEAQE